MSSSKKLRITKIALYIEILIFIANILCKIFADLLIRLSADLRIYEFTNFLERFL